MTEKKAVESEIEAFLGEWGGEGEQPMKNWFQVFFDTVKTMEDVELTFVARPGVSFSIRPKHIRQTDRELFAIIDVIDDDPAERWLSVCFYGDMITDPEGRGEVIPGGLSGSDGYCFDMFEDDKQFAAYLVDRLKEAGMAAGK
ncbi:hypothetical protein DGMP_00170 [Desulfomarina profundi]|uniref:Uncharacterized protein n=1 Tax=Desulfomarina profundi TaxID=2772557 RepID=A0A8D5FJH7_9BACT|nr:hypothetical protein [Desulfomarina profundi]BCL59324.1 hypothetical protein DGMP_00170 [Desulfomarina profundi]